MSIYPRPLTIKILATHMNVTGAVVVREGGPQSSVEILHCHVWDVGV